MIIIITDRYSNCYYPQEIDIMLIGGMMRVFRVHIVASHRYTPSKVDILIAQSNNGKQSKSGHNSMQYMRMCHMTFSQNFDGSTKTYGEKKVLHTNATGSMLKIQIHRPHANGENTMNQVGLLSIKLYGVKANFISKRRTNSAPTMNGRSKSRRNSDSGDSDKSVKLDHANRIIKEAGTKKLFKLDSDSSLESYRHKKSKHSSVSISSDERSEINEADRVNEAKINVIDAASTNDSQPVFDFDFTELDELIELMWQKRDENVKSEKYIKAQQAKHIAQKLEHKRDHLEQMVKTRNTALTQHQYAKAHEIKTEFDAIWYTCPDEFRHLPKFLNNEQKDRFITYFGVIPDENGKMKNMKQENMNYDILRDNKRRGFEPTPWKKAYHQGDGGQAEGNELDYCYIHHTYHNQDAHAVALEDVKNKKLEEQTKVAEAERASKNKTKAALKRKKQQEKKLELLNKIKTQMEEQEKEAREQERREAEMIERERVREEQVRLARLKKVEELKNKTAAQQLKEEEEANKTKENNKKDGSGCLIM